MSLIACDTEETFNSERVAVKTAVILNDRSRLTVRSIEHQTVCTFDIVAAVIVSIFILQTAYQLSKAGIDELLEKSLPREIEEKIKELILSVNKTSAPHHLRTRRIGSSYSINVHVRMERNISLLEAHDIATEIERKLRKEYGEETFINIHMEPQK